MIINVNSKTNIIATNILNTNELKDQLNSELNVLYKIGKYF